MEYTEHNGTIYIAGVMRIIKTPKGYTLMERKTMQGNDYKPIRSEHFDSRELALEEAERLMGARRCCTH